MSIKVAINGYGRIGRNILRAIYENNRKGEVQVVAINDLGLTQAFRCETPEVIWRSGAYAVPGWGWYYDQTPEQITALINANSARLIELERYDRGGGQIRYAAVEVLV